MTKRAKLILIIGPRGSGKIYMANQICEAAANRPAVLFDNWTPTQFRALRRAIKKNKTVVVTVGTKLHAFAAGYLAGPADEEHELNLSENPYLKDTQAECEICGGSRTCPDCDDDEVLRDGIGCWRCGGTGECSACFAAD